MFVYCSPSQITPTPLFIALSSFLIFSYFLAFSFRACAWSADRVALANRYGINDPLEQGTCFSMAYIYFACGCGTVRSYLLLHFSFFLVVLTFSPFIFLFLQCLLIQELNHVKAVQMGLAPGPQGAVPIQKVMVM